MSDVNFIPAERLIAKRRKARISLWTVIGGAYIVLLAVGSLAACVVRPGRDANPAEQLAAAEKQIKQDNDAMVELRRTLAEMTAALETTQAIREQPDWSRLLTGLSREVGQELVLNRCQLVAVREDGKPLTESWSEALLKKPLRALVAKHRYQLVLQGYGQTQESVSQFALGLEGIGLFERVRLINSRRQTFLNGQAVAFTVECYF
jgi:hypothetical protein